ncbi:MAG: DUF1559 domain-containing protein, partial [Planctomycetales bacterium]|nr:DUF1559 domain-containing protein [Planctomycetales bacterium]
AAREAARRSSCSNNLKQLALACHNYHDTYKKFPPTTYDGQYNVNSRGFSWITKVLPFIEQQPLYDQIGVQLGGNVSGTAGGGTSGMALRMDDLINGTRVRQMRLEPLRCPSDVTSELATVVANSFGASGGSATTSYKGVNGSNWGWGGLNISHNGTNNGLDQGSGMFDRYMIHAGMNTWDANCKVINFAAVTDGTANTFMIGESSNRISEHTGCWLHFNHTSGSCAIPLNFKQPSGQFWPANDWGRNYSFHSFHPGGAQFALADASVRFVADTIDINIYRGLATIQQGEAVQVP